MDEGHFIMYEIDENGGFKKIIGEKESAGEINLSLVPKGAKFAKALGTLGAASLESAAFQTPENAVLFYATDDESINADVEQLISDTGFEPVRVGGIDQSIRIEVFGDLHEFGALGKTVTASEAADVDASANHDWQTIVPPAYRIVRCIVILCI